MSHSPYQQNILSSFSALLPGCTIIVRATAGSGKTYTMVATVNECIPTAELSDTIVCAFSKDIQTTLERRMPSAVTCKTFHAVGLDTVKKFLSATVRTFKPGKYFVSGYKYPNMVAAYIKANNLSEFGLTKEEELQFERDLVKVINFVRLNLVNFKDTDAIDAMIERCELDVFSNTSHAMSYVYMAVRECIQWGNGTTTTPLTDKFGNSFDCTKVIDFTDMIALPFYLGAKPFPFLNVLVDECQDLNAAQLWLALHLNKPNGKKLFVGDPNQAIFSFAGADAYSYGRIKEETNATELPLSICYRCSKEVVRLAQCVVPEIEFSETAIDGEVVSDMKRADFLDKVLPGDNVLCRTNAELIETAFELLTLGKRVKVRGRDIMEQITRVVKDIAKQDGFSFDKFEEFAELHRNRIMELLTKNEEKNERKIMMLNDNVDAITAIYGGAVLSVTPPLTVEKLIGVIENLFTDETGDELIILSSIHRAKGLEADNIYLLCPEKLPHPMAKSAIAKEAERCLKFVAYTRAKVGMYMVMSEGKKRKGGKIVSAS